MSKADLIAKIGADTSDFKKGIKETESGASQLGYSFKNLGAAVVGAFAVSAVSSFSSECVQLANVAEGVEAAFKRIGDETMLEGLRKATKGTVSDLELMKAAVQANNFGIPLQQLGSLLEFAHQRAKDTGQSVDYLVQSIVLGIGRKSPLILDNLGISAVALREKFEGLGAEQKSVADVAKAVGEIASEAMSKIGESAETSAEKTARARATMDEWKVSIGKAMQGITDLFAAGVQGVDNFLTSIAKLTTNQNLSFFEKLEAVFGKLTGKGMQADAINEMNDALKETANIQAGELFEGFKLQLQGYKNLDDATKKQIESQAKLNGETYDNALTNAIYDKVNKQISDTYYSLIRQYGEMEALKKKNGKLTNEEYVAYLKIQKLLLDVGKLKKGTDDSIFKMIFGDPSASGGAVEQLGLLEAAKKKIKDLEDAIQKAPTQTIAGKFTADLLTAQKELENLQKKIKVEAFGEPAATGLRPMQALPATSVGSTDSLAAGLTGMQEWAKNYKSATDQVIAANDQVEVSMAGFATSFAEGLGGVLAGTETLGDAFIGAMAGFMGQLGQQMIAVGFAGIALKKVISNPVLAVAAGMTLVALAGAARATMSSGVGGGGSRSRGGSTSTYSGTGNNEMTIQIEGVTKGSEIYWSQKNYNTRLNSTISR